MERHTKFINDPKLPAKVRQSIPDAMSVQTVAMGVDKKNKRIIVAGNIYTNDDFKKDGSHTIRPHN